jgi:uncharacterized protein YndB with AHSA1/START domain
MKWALIVVGTLVAVVVLVVVIGALLPRDHVAAMSARIAGAPDAVWRTITDPGAFPTWRKDVTRVDLLPPTANGASWREYSRNGTITMVIDASDAPRRLVTRIADENLPFGGTWEYRLVPATGGATMVTIVERGSVSNPLFRSVSRFVMGHTATIEAYLRALTTKYGGEPQIATVAIAGAAAEEHR